MFSGTSSFSIRLRFSGTKFVLPHEELNLIMKILDTKDEKRKKYMRHKSVNKIVICLAI
jgi:hypothetical protein